MIKKWLTKCADDSETANYISAHTKDVSVALYTDLFCNGISVLFTFYIFHKRLFGSCNISVSVWCVFFCFVFNCYIYFFFIALFFHVGFLTFLSVEFLLRTR